MTNEQKQVKDWMLAMGQECPAKPTVPSLEVRKLRAKLIFEEALETIEALGVRIYGKDSASGKEFEASSEYFHCITIEDWCEPDLEKIADGCEDLKVVTEGTLVACGLVKPGYVTFLDSKPPTDPLFDEVMRSNWTKFWNDGDDAHVVELKQHPEYIVTEVKKHPEVDVSLYVVKDPSGKVMKSPSYEPPNLKPIIDSL
jgi:predicted HAD superfamily Cof-like phosphohydrolase